MKKRRLPYAIAVIHTPHEQYRIQCHAVADIPEPTDEIQNLTARLILTDQETFDFVSRVSKQFPNITLGFMYDDKEPTPSPALWTLRHYVLMTEPPDWSEPQ